MPALSEHHPTVEILGCLPHPCQHCCLQTIAGAQQQSGFQPLIVPQHLAAQLRPSQPAMHAQMRPLADPFANLGPAALQLKSKISAAMAAQRKASKSQRSIAHHARHSP